MPPLGFVLLALWAGSLAEWAYHSSPLFPLSHGLFGGIGAVCSFACSPHHRPFAAPADWALESANCSGSLQSPIDIVPSSALTDSADPLTVSITTLPSIKIENDGNHGSCSACLCLRC